MFMVRRKVQTTTLIHALTCGAAGLAFFGLGACSGGSSGGPSPGSQTSSFEVQGISVSEGQNWEINRPIEFSFTKPVDFASVDLNTITFTDSTGLPASGEFFLKDSQTVVFQPTCPTLDDFSDSGFQPGGITYQIKILGEDSDSLALASLEGDQLETSQTRNFTTPVTLSAQELFLDAVVGPPSPVIRPTGSSDLNACYLEVGKDDSNRIYFEFDQGLQTFTQPVEQPINLYSQVSSQLAFVVEINQPVNPASTNINSDKLFLEFEESPGSWTQLSTRVELIRNCTSTGATLRLEPLGILPQLSMVRVVISPGFEDLVGERNLLPVDGFAALQTEEKSFDSLAPNEKFASDEVREEFNQGGGGIDSLEDVETPFGEPRALWDGGELAAAFSFEGTGGPNADFDFFVPDGVTIIIDTTADTVFGGPFALPPDFFTNETMGDPNFANTTTQTVINGVINCRNFGVHPNGELRAQGPNPLFIQATGSCVIRGLVVVEGSPAANVATLNTGNQPEPGASGQGGGGRGGTASFLTNTSTPKGGNGLGAFNIPNLGGAGGDSGFGTGGKNNRRPGGGGGGSFSPINASGQAGSGTIGVVAEAGHRGNNNATSAITFTKPPQGGPAALTPFQDAFDDNDFLGVQVDSVSGELILGELQSVFAGSGGGAGGDAIPANQFPHPNWAPGTDEKGSGAGGGGGGLRIQALGKIRIAGNGRLNVDGGKGGSGENTIFNDRIGGGSGGGGGGHVIIETSLLDLQGAQLNAIRALGGKAGNGANENPNVQNAGGDGGPGVVQVHVPDPATDIVLSGAATLDSRTAPDAVILLPTFGAVSRALSEWIPLGGATVDPGGVASVVEFAFDGTDPATGLVLDVDQDGVVDEVASILSGTGIDLVLAGDPLGTPTVPFVSADGRTLVVDATSLETAGFNDVYLRNTVLLQSFDLVLFLNGSPGTNQHFDVETASYDEALGELSLSIGSGVPDLFSFSLSGSVDFDLVPKFFLIATDGTIGSLPDSTISITFEGASDLDGDGQPDVDTLLVPSTADISLLQVPSLAFYRFEVLFDIDASGQGLSGLSPRPALRFLRVPIRF